MNEVHEYRENKVNEIRIGDRVTGMATAQSSGPSGSSANKGRQVTGKVIGIDPRPRNHLQGEYLVVKEDNGPVVFINTGDPGVQVHNS